MARMCIRGILNEVKTAEDYCNVGGGKSSKIALTLAGNEEIFFKRYLYNKPKIAEDYCNVGAKKILK